LFAFVASKLIDGFRAAADRPKAGDVFVVNPATGALEIAPAYRDKAAKALEREVCRGKRSLGGAFFRLYFRKLLLECRNLAAVADDEASLLLFDGPRRREAARCHEELA
jgi:hypothetical protein